MDGNTKSSKALTTTSSIKLDPIRDFKQIQEFALAIVDSDTANVFKKPGAEKADVADVIGAISIGLEIGIPPMSAISLGKTLNAKSYLSVLKGKSMGIDPITSIAKIHNIETGNGSVLYTSVDLISKAILDSGTTMKIIRDYEPTPMYYDLASNAYLGHHWKIFDRNNIIKPLYFLWKEGVDKNDVKKAIDEGKIIIRQSKQFTYVTTIHFVRKAKGIDEEFSYSTQEAIDAELLNGFHSWKLTQNGDKQTPFWVKGKLNWNNNTPQMLRNRCISIPGRIIVADILQGIYTEDEVVDMGERLEEVQEAQIVE